LLQLLPVLQVLVVYKAT
jgi:hypothetical protein